MSFVAAVGCCRWYALYVYSRNPCTLTVTHIQCTWHSLKFTLQALETLFDCQSLVYILLYGTKL